MRTRVLSAAVVAALLLPAVAGCTASGGGSGTAAAGTSGKAFAGAERPAATGAGKAVADAATQADRSVVTTGTLRLVSDAPVRAADRITALVEAAAGHVADSTEDPSGRATADLTLRIPAAVFPTTLTAIEREGRVQNVSVQATDVTATVTDYAVRIANLKTSIARLQQLLSEATSNADLVQLESSLTDRQGSLEQLLAQQRALADEVTYATLTVSVVVPAAAPKAGPVDFLGGLVTGTDGLVQTLAALAVVAGVLLPWVVVLGLLGGAVTLVVRAVRRRARPRSA